MLLAARDAQPGHILWSSIWPLPAALPLALASSSSGKAPAHVCAVEGISTAFPWLQLQHSATRHKYPAHKPSSASGWLVPLPERDNAATRASPAPCAPACHPRPIPAEPVRYLCGEGSTARAQCQKAAVQDASPKPRSICWGLNVEAECGGRKTVLQNSRLGLSVPPRTQESVTGRCGATQAPPNPAPLSPLSLLCPTAALAFPAP